MKKHQRPCTQGDRSGRGGGGDKMLKNSKNVYPPLKIWQKPHGPFQTVLIYVKDPPMDVQFNQRNGKPGGIPPFKTS
jgi:hypothetical protein